MKSSLVARWAHNPEIGGSNPPVATIVLWQDAKLPPCSFDSRQIDGKDMSTQVGFTPAEGVDLSERTKLNGDSLLAPRIARWLGVLSPNSDKIRLLPELDSIGRIQQIFLFEPVIQRKRVQIWPHTAITFTLNGKV